MSDASIKEIKNTYQEIEDVDDEKIELQLEFAKSLVDIDIKKGILAEDMRRMAVTYMCCHLLYINYFKTSEDKLNGNTSDKKLTPKLGMGLQGSPYGQMYLTFINSSMEDSQVVSGIGILS